MIYQFGAAGTLNIGDTAIWEGIKAQYPDAVQIYVNKPTVESAVWYADLLSGRVGFAHGATKLLIGGGGILHCTGAVEDYLAMAIKAREQGLDVTIEGVGLNGIRPLYETQSAMLLSMASKITVRDTDSIEIAKRLGYKATLVKDFAYNLNLPDWRNIPRFGIGVIPTASSHVNELVHHIALILKYSDVYLIPHSRAYVSSYSNDVCTCERIWSNWGLHQPGLHNLYVLPFTDDPIEGLNRVASMTGIYSDRLHGCYFADITMTPVTSPKGKPKLDAFYKDSKYWWQFENDRELETWVKAVTA
jgi:hypothetical protein